MFFSLIQAPNQLSPKTKVVDLLYLYNFYFGQISCSNVKFGAWDGQSRLKIPQFGHCASLFHHCARPRRDRRRHASVVAANLVPREPSYPLPVPVPIRTISSPSLSSRRAEPSRPPPAFVPAKLAAPSLFPAPQPSSPHPAPPTPLPEPTDPLPGRIGLPTAGMAYVHVCGYIVV